MRGKNNFNYYEEFIKQSQFAVESGELLYKTVQNFSVETLGATIIEMHNFEHSADIEKHNMMSYLLKDFLPPIEREDIISLSQKIDDVTDAVEDVLIRVDIFNIQEIREEIYPFAELVVCCCKAIHKLLIDFKHFKRSTTLHENIIEINRLEEEGDALFTSTVRNLYRNGSDPVTLMIWTDILSRFEKCFDACEDVANDVESIVLKNS